MGSPMYMAPEQLNLKSILDRRTDIYALGILLHQMMTASTPYAKNTTQKELFDNINNIPLDRILDLYPGSDPRFQDIIDKATQKDPKDRFQSCDEFLIEIQALADYEDN